jgi:class 3 adenylate cyclase
MSTVKRKIAAILAADIAGYSRLVAQDEEETLRRLATSRTLFDERVAQWGGRIFNTAGDAALAEFPSAVDAVRCALEIQAGMIQQGKNQEGLGAPNLSVPPDRRMLYRIGITVADVVERDGDLLGDGVNIAARLAGIAIPGGICVSHTVHEQVANKLPVGFEDLGQQQMKNIPNPIHAYRIAAHPAAIGSPPVGGARRRNLRLAGLALAGALGVVAIALLPHDLPPGSSLAGSTPVALPPAGRDAGPPFDDAKIRALAGSQSIPLPPTLRVKVPAAGVPARLAGYLGAWGGDQGWNGGGRRVILVVESIDESGTALGILAQGPPADATVPDQRPARYRSVAGTITDAGIVFTLAGATYTFKDTADGLMWGHVQMPGGKVELTIALERID